MTYVIVVDPEAPAKNEVRRWLRNSGFVAWLANDLSHAIEEVSDFTVKTRPDVVMLEMAFHADSFETLRSAFDMSGNGEKITVLGLTGRKFSKGRFAKNMDQLTKMMGKRPLHSF